MVSIATTQLCCCSLKTARDNTSSNEHGCVPVKLYFQKTGGHSLPTPVSDSVQEDHWVAIAIIQARSEENLICRQEQ